MYIKYSMSVLMSHLTIIFKTLIFIIIVALIIAAVGAGMLLPAYNKMKDLIIETGAFDSIGRAFTDIAAGGDIPAAVEQIRAGLIDLRDTVVNNANTLWLSYFLLSILALAANFLIATLYLPLADNVDKYISSRHDGYLLQEYFLMMKKSLPFALLYSLINTILSVLIVWLAILVMFALKSVVNLLTVNMIAFMVITLYSLKASLLCDWIPNILSGKGVLRALWDSLKGGSRRVFSLRLSSNILVMSVIYIVALLLMSSFGYALIIGTPFFICYFRIFELVSYKMANKQKFYADDYVIITPN